MASRWLSVRLIFPRLYSWISLVRDALLATETAFPDLGTFGVEGSEAGRGRRSPAFDYLNTGDAYELTVLHVRGRYTVGTWGDIVERGDYA